MCEQCERREERDRAFWRTVRRALLMVASAIAERYPEGRNNSSKAA